MFEIPLSSDAPHFSQEHVIFGRMYGLEFEWVEREQYWVMHVFDGSEQPIALGLRVSASWPVFYDQAAHTVFMLIAKKPHAQLTLKTFHKDFMLVAYAPL